MSDGRHNRPSLGPARRVLSLVLAGVLAGWAVWQSAAGCARVMRDAAQVSPSLAEVMVQRLVPARTALQDARSVRYVQIEENYDPVTAEARRAIAGYALVPVLVTDDPGESLILADFADDPTLAAYMRSHPVSLIEHLGPGLGLLEVDRP